MKSRVRADRAAVPSSRGGGLAPLVWALLLCPALGCGAGRHSPTVPAHTPPTVLQRAQAVPGPATAAAATSQIAPEAPREPQGPCEASQTCLAAQIAQTSAREALEGDCSYYSDSLAGRRTASGAPYVPEYFTAAHRTLRFGTLLRVTRTDTGSSVLVKVNDRGPFGRKRRVLDLSRAAAEQLNMIRRGVARVRVEVMR